VKDENGREIDRAELNQASVWESVAIDTTGITKEGADGQAVGSGRPRLCGDIEF